MFYIIVNYFYVNYMITYDGNNQIKKSNDFNNRKIVISTYLQSIIRKKSRNKRQKVKTA